jgi:TrmH family RNA methyltransferase
MQITSSQNPRIKQLAKLRDNAHERRRQGLMLVEGKYEVHLALQAGYRPVTIIRADEFATEISGSADETIDVSRRVFESLSRRDHPDGWLAVFPVPVRRAEDLQLGQDPLILVAQSIEKPGNLGAMLRTADAAGLDSVLVCDRRVDLYGPNVVRASRGTVFTVPTVLLSSQDALEFLRRHKIRILAASPDAEADYTRQDLRGPLAIAVGSEDRGLEDGWLEEADVRIKIPMHGKVNSLNVSVATALIVYEALRQRAA